MLVTNLHVLEADLIQAGEGEVLVRPDRELLEAVGEELDGLMWEAMSAQVSQDTAPNDNANPGCAQWDYECVLVGEDRQREVARRRALYALGTARGWNVCGWCEEEVDLYEWATGRLCGHQFHHVSGNEHTQIHEL